MVILNTKKGKIIKSSHKTHYDEMREGQPPGMGKLKPKWQRTPPISRTQLDSSNSSERKTHSAHTQQRRHKIDLRDPEFFPSADIRRELDEQIIRDIKKRMTLDNEMMRAHQARLRTYPQVIGLRPSPRSAAAWARDARIMDRLRGPYTKAERDDDTRDEYVVWYEE